LLLTLLTSGQVPDFSFDGGHKPFPTLLNNVRSFHGYRDSKSVAQIFD
jgi:hypothetical protein